MGKQAVRKRVFIFFERGDSLQMAFGKGWEQLCFWLGVAYLKSFSERAQRKKAVIKCVFLAGCSSLKKVFGKGWWKQAVSK